MNRKRIILILVAILLASVGRGVSEAGQRKMYWVEYGSKKVRCANLDGSNVQDLVTTGVVIPYGIALDVSNGKVYWTDASTRKIQRANLDGSNVETLISGLSRPEGIAVDILSGKIYWTDYGTRKIQRANLNGSNLETIVLGLSRPEGITLDVSNGKVYWTDASTRKIQRANLNGSNLETIVLGLSRPEGITLDVSNGKVYWTDYGTRKIQRANLDGSNLETLISGLSRPEDIALDVSSDKMYWIDKYPGSIQRANLDGSNIETIVSGLSRPKGIALDVSGTTPPPTGTNVISTRVIKAQDLHLTDHTGDVRCVAYSPAGGVLASGGTDNTIRLWRVSTGELLNTLDKHTRAVNSIAWTPNDTYIASGSDDGTVRLWKWSMAAGTWIAAQSFTIPSSTLANKVKSVAFSHDNTILACGTSGNKVYLWDYNFDKEMWEDRTVLTGHTRTVNSVAFSPGGVVLASGSDDNTIRLWHARTGEHLTTLKRGTADVNSVVFSRNDAFLVSGNDDGTVILWKWDVRADTWQHYRTLDRHTDSVRSVAFNTAGTVLLSGSADKTIGVWDGQTGTYKTSLTEHTEGVNSVAFAFQGNVLASGSDDNTVRQLTSTESTGVADKSIGLELPSDFITEVAFGPNSTYFILNAQFPTLTGMPAADVVYKKCKITVDIPGVPDEPVARKDSGNSRLRYPGYYMFPIKTPEHRIEEVESTLARELGVELVGFIPIFGNIVGTLWEVGKADLAIHTILQSTADPTVTIDNFDLLNGNDIPILFYLSSRVSSIGIKVEQEYNLKSKAQPFRFDPTYTITDEGMWNLADGTWTAPNAQLMSLKEYPPFQLLLPEVQAYLLQHFGKLRNAEAWLIPEETSLLPNYPNPFNPETWVPYQLAEAADVTLTIYDIKGHVVRDLDLGHQSAGVYHSQERAASWNGRNAQGEPVASGVYFYTLTAGEFAATRKMLITK